MVVLTSEAVVGSKHRLRPAFRRSRAQFHRFA
jgi:hypothetical protein